MRSALLLIATFVFASGCFYVDPGPPGSGTNSSGTITVDNASTYVLTEVHVTGVRSSTWGPNLLRTALRPNDRLTVSVACNTYDVMIVDEFNRGCVLSAVDLCFSNSVWVIDNSTLRNCAF